jgi:hypothetical protein
MDGHWGRQEREVSSNGANLDLIDNFASTTFNHKKCCIIVYLEDRYIWTEAVKNVEGWHCPQLWNLILKFEHVRFKLCNFLSWNETVSQCFYFICNSFILLELIPSGRRSDSHFATWTLTVYYCMCSNSTI